MTVTVCRADGEIDVFGNVTSVRPDAGGWRVRHRNGAEQLVEKIYPEGAWLSLNCDAREAPAPERFPPDAKVIGW